MTAAERSEAEPAAVPASPARGRTTLTFTACVCIEAGADRRGWHKASAREAHRRFPDAASLKEGDVVDRPAENLPGFSTLTITYEVER